MNITGSTRVFLILGDPVAQLLVQQVPEYPRFFGFDTIARAVQADASDLRALVRPA